MENADGGQQRQLLWSQGATKELASNDITVVLTARNESLGSAATHGLHMQALKNVDFHTLDIGVPDSVPAFAVWLKTTYGGLDILVNGSDFYYSEIVGLFVSSLAFMFIELWKLGENLRIQNWW